MVAAAESPKGKPAGFVAMSEDDKTGDGKTHILAASDVTRLPFFLACLALIFLLEPLDRT